MFIIVWAPLSVFLFQKRFPNQKEEEKIDATLRDISLLTSALYVVVFMVLMTVFIILMKKIR